MDGRRPSDTNIALMTYHDFMLKAVKLNPECLRPAIPSLLNDRDFMLEALKINAECLKHASTALTEDSDFMLEATKRNPECLAYTRAAFQDDRSLTHDGRAANRSPERQSINHHALKLTEHQSYREGHTVCRMSEMSMSRAGRCSNVPMMSVKNSLKNHACASQTGVASMNYRNFMLKAVKINPDCLRPAIAALTSDRDFMLEAVNINPECLVHADPALRKDRAFMLEAVKSNPECLVHSYLRGDRAFMLRAIEISAACLAYADPALRKCDDFVLEAVKTNPACLRHADSNLSNDREFLLKTMKITLPNAGGTRSRSHSPSSTRSQSPTRTPTARSRRGTEMIRPTVSLCGDREFMLQAVELCPEVLTDAHIALKNDREFMLEAMKVNPECLLHADIASADNGFAPAAINVNDQFSGPHFP